MKTDSELQIDVMEALICEPALNNLQLGVAVKNGIVTLAGQVDYYFQKSTAQRAAKSVAGIRALTEEIIVGSLPEGGVTDAEIARVILDALHWNSAVVDEKIKVKVEDGRVTLEGETQWDYQRSQAQKMIERIHGVKSVSNQVALKLRPTPSDVQQQVKQALKRLAGIDQKKIMVDVVQHNIVLRGEVASIAERETVEKTAWSAPGITGVENRLKVLPQIASQQILL